MVSIFGLWSGGPGRARLGQSGKPCAPGDAHGDDRRHPALRTGHFPGVVPSKKPGRLAPRPHRSRPGTARRCASACLSASAEVKGSQASAQGDLAFVGTALEPVGAGFALTGVRQIVAVAAQKILAAADRAWSRDGGTAARSSPPGRRNRCACRRTCRGWCLAMGGVAHKPWRRTAAEQALKGKQNSLQAFEEAATVAMQGAKGYGDNNFKLQLGPKKIVEALRIASGV